MNTDTNINNTIASATTTAANNLLADVTTWKETALNLSRILTEQTEIVNLLNKKLVDLSFKNEVLTKENVDFRFRLEALVKSEFEDMFKNDTTKKSEDVMTKITFVNSKNFNNEVLYVIGEIRLKDLPKEMQDTFESQCTIHFGKTDPVIENCLIMLGNFDDDRIEIEIVDKDDAILFCEGESTVEKFINEYNKFTSARNF